MVSLVAAIDVKTNGIGINGGLPWNLPADMEYFKNLTTRTEWREEMVNIVVMGRKTWESIPAKFRPLKGRVNVVLSREKLDLDEYPETYHETCLENVIKRFNAFDYEYIFIIGGEGLYKEAIEKELVDHIFLTEIKSDKDIVCDRFFPMLDMSEYDTEIMGSSYSNYVNNHCYHDEKNGLNLSYEFKKYSKKKNTEETQYLDIIKEIIGKGVRKGNRTDVETLSVFGRTMRYSLRDGSFPLLTTKRVFWRGVAEELLWFISGSTNSNVLVDKKVNILKDNTSREFLDNRGLNGYKEGDCGPVYGFQWRHFGAEYTDMDGDYSGKGFDQLKYIIDTIKTDPNSRRLVISAWNPPMMDQMCLPPCHAMLQFYVENGELSCQMYQRSCDIGLGVPFNIASYSLLTVLIAKCTGLKPGEFIHVLGDAHIYVNHIEGLEKQIKREPRLFPRLKINTDNIDIDNFKFEDFEIIGYRPFPSIKLDMVA